MANAQLSPVMPKPLRRSFIFAIALHLLLMLAAIHFIYQHLHSGKVVNTLVHSYVYPVESHNISGNHKNTLMPHPQQKTPQQQGQYKKTSKLSPATAQTQASRYQHSHGNSVLLMALHNAIQQQQHYPALALFNQVSGTAVVHFTLATNGQLQNIKLVSSSGHATLDKAALQAVSAISPFTQIKVKKAKSMSIKVRFLLQS